MATALSREFIQVCAEQLGLAAGGPESASRASPREEPHQQQQQEQQEQQSTLSQEAVAVLAPDAEYRIREIIQVACKFMRRAHRDYLTAEDVNSALAARRVPSLFGYSRHSGLRVPSSSSSSSSSAEGSSGGISSGQVGEPRVRFARAREGLYFIEDREVSVAEVLEAPLPPLPREIEATVHWLAVEGVIPQIPANVPDRKVALAGADAQALLTTARAGGGALAPVASSSALASGSSALAALLSATTVGGEIEVPTAGDPSRASKRRRITAGTAASLAAHSDKINLTREHVRPTVEHVLSKELRRYYEVLMSALVNTEHDSVVIAALDSLKRDAGISQLLPYLAQFVVDEVAHAVYAAARSQSSKRKATEVSVAASEAGLVPLRRLQRVLGVCEAIFENKTLFVEPYLHQLLPAMLTCAVGKDLGEDLPPTPEHPDNSHWAIREAATELIASVCSKYGRSYVSLQPRVIQTYLSALAIPAGESTPARPVATQYGAIVGITRLGANAIASALLPVIHGSYAQWLGSTRADGIDKLRQKVQDAISLWLAAQVDLLHARGVDDDADQIAAALRESEASSAPFAAASEVLGEDAVRQLLDAIRERSAGPPPLIR